MFKRIKARERNILGRRPIRGVLSIEKVQALSKGELLDLLDLGYQLPMAGGMTTAQNATAASPTYFPMALCVTSDQTINQGDMVWWDSVNYTLKPLTAVGQVAIGLGTGGFCGCAAGTSNPGVYPTPPSGQSEALPGIVVQRGGSVYLNGTAGDGAYLPFQPVTVGADAQTVSRGGETTADRVGFVLVRPPVSPRGASGATPVPETDNSGRPQVWLTPTFPATSLT
jgi:hypothetical protein